MKAFVCFVAILAVSVSGGRSRSYQQSSAYASYDDYIVPVNYEFNYGVKDYYTGQDFKHTENRQGVKTSGSYEVALPDGRVQVVTYVADENGFVADVSYRGTVQYDQKPYAPPKPYTPQPSYPSKSAYPETYSSDSAPEPYTLKPAHLAPEPYAPKPSYPAPEPYTPEPSYPAPEPYAPEPSYPAPEPYTPDPSYPAPEPDTPKPSYPAPERDAAKPYPISEPYAAKPYPKPSYSKVEPYGRKPYPERYPKPTYPYPSQSSYPPRTYSPYKPSYRPYPKPQSYRLAPYPTTKSPPTHYDGPLFRSVIKNPPVGVAAIEDVSAAVEDSTEEMPVARIVQGVVAPVQVVEEVASSIAAIEEAPVTEFVTEISVASADEPSTAEADEVVTEAVVEVTTAQPNNAAPALGQDDSPAAAEPVVVQEAPAAVETAIAHEAPSVVESAVAEEASVAVEPEIIQEAPVAAEPAAAQEDTPATEVAASAPATEVPVSEPVEVRQAQVDAKAEPEVEVTSPAPSTIRPKYTKRPSKAKTTRHPAFAAILASHTPPLPQPLTGYPSAYLSRYGNNPKPFTPRTYKFSRKI